MSAYTDLLKDFIKAYDIDDNTKEKAIAIIDEEAGDMNTSVHPFIKLDLIIDQVQRQNIKMSPDLFNDANIDSSLYLNKQLSTIDKALQDIRETLKLPLDESQYYKNASLTS